MKPLAPAAEDRFGETISTTAPRYTIFSNPELYGATLPVMNPWSGDPSPEPFFSSSESYIGDNPYGIFGNPAQISLYYNNRGDSTIIEYPPAFSVGPIGPKMKARVSRKIGKYNDAEWPIMKQRFLAAKKNKKK